MSATDKISAKEIIIVFIVLVAMGIGMFVTLGVFSRESEQKEQVVSDAGAKDPNNLEVYIKLLSVDPIKGDATARLEFVPHGKLAAEDGTLSQDLKFSMPAVNGKNEVEMKKGKAIAAVDATFSMYGGNAADYPFDAHKAYFYLYADKVAPKKEEAPKPPPAEAHDSEQPTGHEAAKAEPESTEVPLDVSFFGSLPGYKIGVQKEKESDETYVAGDITIQRSGLTVAFSIFVAAVMWGLSLAVLFLVASLIIRGRKVEIAMFSFMAALLFAYYAVRNSQPNIPPIGVYGDFLSFFWAEILVGACLLVAVFTWVFRAAKS
ncbi:MAG: DUF4436 family protein [Acidobacteria bacterium]|nr:DUF4436 family protein [Acidobacteriota bacterium]